MDARFIVTSLFSLMAASGLNAQELPDRKTALETFAKDAQIYEMTVQTLQPARLELHPQPVLNWTGSAFVWVKDGRPEVIGAFWNSLEPRTGRVRSPHALHSLSEHPIKAEFKGTLVWNPQKPGLSFRPIDGAEPPADKPWRRLAQMRELARDFSVVGIYTRFESPRRPLRLFTQPIYRYEPTAGVTQDGAIFVYSADVEFTDPDALLVVEARQFEGKPRWEYAFARFHFIDLTGYHRDKEVWKMANDWPETKQHRFGFDPGREKAYYSVDRP